MSYRGKHAEGKHRRRREKRERFQRPGSKCLPAAELLAQLLGEPGRVIGQVPMLADATAVYTRPPLLVRPYVAQGVC